MTATGPRSSRQILSRRSLMLGLAACAAGGPALARGTDGDDPEVAGLPDPVRLAAATLQQGPSTLRNPALLVAGPADAPTGRWATLLAPKLGDALSPGAQLAVSTSGGRDGVTGANEFDAQTTPDGSTALLVPGAAAIAWLAGDPRVHFDAGRWVPALAGLSSCVLVGRPVGSDTAFIRRSIRLAMSSPTGAELPAFLGLSLLGAHVSPVSGLSAPEDCEAALRQGRVDAVFLTGHDVPKRLAALQAAGFAPLFSLGSGTDDPADRDPALPAVPAFPELIRGQTGRAPGGSLFTAWQAVAAAARLDVALVLPLLAPAALVARWRSACQSALSDLGLASAVRDADVQPLAAPDCVRALAQIDADETTQLALRRWLVTKGIQQG